MSISCECDEGSEWWFEAPTDFSMMHVAQRRRRCYCCREFIRPLADCGRVKRTRPPTEFEEYSLGWDECDPVAMPDVFLCEECTGLMWAVLEQGYCVYLERRPMREQVAEALSGE